MATITAAPAWSRSLILLAAGAILLNYIDRGSLGVAGPLIKGELGLSATQFGIAVSAFFWIYAPIQLLVGWLCDRLCVYRLFGAGVALWALATLLTGFIGGLLSLVLLRLVLGLGESIAFPGSSKIIARHVPASRRGFANSCVSAGIALGPAIGTLVGGLIMISFGWRAMFIIFGLITFLWLVPWQIVSGPLLKESMARREAPFPPSRLLGKPALWGMCVGHFAGNYSLYFILAWLPLYLVQSRGYSIADMTMLATIVYLAQAASAFFFGWLSDHLVAGGREEGPIRRTLLAVSFVATATAIIGISTAASLPALVGWLILAGICFGIGSLNLYAVSQIFAGPRAVGTWVGIQNCMGNLAGIVGPIVTGVIVDRTGSYIYAFIVVAGISLVGAVAWMLLPRIEQVAVD
jgi:MFS family permease